MCGSTLKVNVLINRLDNKFGRFGDTNMVYFGFMAAIIHMVRLGIFIVIDER
jgi:hypothetical protein